MFREQEKRNRLIKNIGYEPQVIVSERDNWKQKYFSNRSELEKLKASERQKIQEVKSQKRLKIMEDMISQKETTIKRKSSQSLKKITFFPKDPKYSQTPFYPGFCFFEAILDNKKIPSSLLKLNLPHMLYIRESQSHWVYSDPKTHRILDNQEFLKHEVYKSFETFREQSELCAILRHPTSLPDMEANILGWVEFSDKLLKGNLTSGTMIQRYIKPNGDRPSIVRLFYISETKANKASFAYCIVSSIRAIEQYSQAKHIVCSDIISGFDIYPMHGLAIIELEITAKKIVDFLQLAYSVRIEEIVFDFIRDSKGEYWFLGCKGFNLDIVVLKARELKLLSQRSKSSEAIKEELDNMKDQRLSAMHCKLCLLPFKPYEMEHILPFKMLLLYKRHSKKSGKKGMKLSHIRVLALDFLSQWVRLCNLCYMLIVQENELIEVETKLASILNVEIKPEDLTRQPVFDHPAFMPNLVCQWRVLIYFKSLEPPESIKFNYLYFHLKFLERTVTMKIGKMHNVSCKKLNTARLFYFFALDEAHARKLCFNEDFNIFLSKDQSGSKTIANGTSKVLRSFNCEKQETTSMTQPLEIILFSQLFTNFKLNLVSGLACDHILNSKSLQTNIKKYNSVYIPEKSYFSSDSLPDSWMEIFDPEYKGNESSDLLNSSEELDQVYSPTLEKDLILNPSLGPGKIQQEISESNLLKNIITEKPQEQTKISFVQKRLSLNKCDTILDRNMKPYMHSAKSSHSQRSTLPTPSSTRALRPSSSFSNINMPPVISLTSKAKLEHDFKKTIFADLQSDLLHLSTTVSEFLSRRTNSEEKLNLVISSNKEINSDAKSKDYNKKKFKSKKIKRPSTAVDHRLEKKINLVDIYAHKEIDNLRLILENEGK